VKAIIATVKSAAEKADLGVDQAAELRSEIATVEAQVQSPKPKGRTIKDALGTIQRILEGAGGNIVAALLPELIKRIAGL
jgi:hypothetical protein